ncbi:hypothetical protein AHAS_Ahas14G0174500 [Arachis hypogaea]
MLTCRGQTLLSILVDDVDEEQIARLNQRNAAAASTTSSRKTVTTTGNSTSTSHLIEGPLKPSRASLAPSHVTELLASEKSHASENKILAIS